MLHKTRLKRKCSALRHFGIFLAIFLCSSPTIGLNQTVKFEHVTLFKGQQSITISDIAQDSIGFLWFATTSGLFRYDGYHYKRFVHNENDSTSLFSTKIFKMTIDPQGELWIINRNILSKYNPVQESFTHYPINTINDKNFYSITSDSFSIWLGGLDGILYQFEKDTKQTKHFSLIDYNKNDKTCIIRDLSTIDSLLWITSEGGLFKFNKKSHKIIALSTIFPNLFENNSDFSRGLLIDNDKNIFFGTGKNTLNQIQNGQLISYQFLDLKHPNSDNERSRRSQKIHAICSDLNGNLWLTTTSEGLVFFNCQTKEFTSSRLNPDKIQGIEHWALTKVFVDNSGIIWVSRAGEGLFKSQINPFKIKNYEKIINPQDSSSNDYITDIAELSDGRLVFVIDHNGIALFDPVYETFEFIKRDPTSDNSLCHESINSVNVDQNDIIWLASQKGLLKFDPMQNNFKHFLPEPTVSLNPDFQKDNLNLVSAIYESADSILWIGTNIGLYKFDKVKQRFSNKYLCEIPPQYQSKIGPGAGAVRCIEEGKNGSLWLGTAQAGILLFDPQIEQFTHPITIENDKNLPIPIVDIFKDTKNTIWISSAFYGFYSFNYESQELIHYKDCEGMLSNKVHEIIEDSLSNLWICYKNGVSLFDYNNITFTSFTESEDVNFFLVDKNDWFRIKSVPDADNASTKIIADRNNTYSTTGFTAKNGTVYFGGPNGFTQIDPHFLTPIINQKVQLISFKIFNKSIKFDEPVYNLRNIRLKHTDYIFSFEFMHTDLSDVKKNHFAFWLKGFEKDWRYTGSENKREFVNVPPGKYTLLVKACNNFGIWTDDPLKINIIITPPFWRTLWFRIIIGMSVAGIIGFVFWYRIHQIQGQKKLLEVQVRKRTKELHESNKQLVEEIQFRKKAEEELRKSEEEYRDLFENAYDVIWISDIEGNIQAINHFFQQLLGYAKDEIIGKNMMNYISDEHRFRAIRNYLKFKRDHLIECELNFKTRDNGLRILWLKIRGIYENSTIIGIHGIGRDSTDLKKTQAELQEAERMKRESLKQLTLKLAHEIKNPLTSITSSAQLVASSKDNLENPKIQRHMNIINKNVNICNQVIRELYSFTHKPELNFTIIQIPGFITELRSYAESKIENNPLIKINTTLGESTNDILGDKFRLEQAFSNIINNAFDAMPEAGTLTINAYSTDSTVCIEISDTGCGMSEETIQNIFKPFYTSKASGFGLGMPVVKDIIDAHQGSINIISKPGQGSTFSIYLNTYQTKEINQEDI